MSATPHTGSGGSIGVFLCGDVMLGRGIDQVLPHPSDPRLYESYVASAMDYLHLAESASGPIPRPVDFAYVWGTALAEWRRRAPDVRVVNLETSITRSEAYVPKGINYRMSPENADCLVAAGIDCCVLANNHVLDWGSSGLTETLEVLRRRGLQAAGAGRNAAEAAAPAILDVAGKGRVIVLSLAAASSGTPRDWAATAAQPGVNLTELSASAVETIGGQIERIRRPRDVVIASIHWGANWGYAIPAAQRRFAHALVDRAKVSIVHGHSSHHPKAIEVYNNRLILYGCGDFLNDYEGIEGFDELRDDLAVMYFVAVDPEHGDCVRVDMVPLQIKRMQLSRPTDSDIALLRETLDRESRRFGCRIERTADDALRLTWDYHSGYAGRCLS